MLANNCCFDTCQKVCAYQKTKMCASALEWSSLNVKKHWICHEKEAQFGKIVSLNEHVSDWKRWRNESVQSQSQSHSHKPETKLNFNQHWFILIEESRWVSFCLCIYSIHFEQSYMTENHTSHIICNNKTESSHKVQSHQMRLNMVIFISRWVPVPVPVPLPDPLPRNSLLSCWDYLW